MSVKYGHSDLDSEVVYCCCSIKHVDLEEHFYASHVFVQCLLQTLLDISEEFAMKLVKADESSDQNERELMK